MLHGWLDMGQGRLPPRCFPWVLFNWGRGDLEMVYICRIVPPTTTPYQVVNNAPRSQHAIAIELSAGFGRGRTTAMNDSDEGAGRQPLFDDRDS